MTMPHLMNCRHSETGWCLDCVKELWDESTMTNERKNITQPSDWWVAFEAQAKAEGMNLSAWLGKVAKAKLPANVAKKLSERPAAHRPKGVNTNG